jgi:hypothetical protein
MKGEEDGTVRGEMASWSWYCDDGDNELRAKRPSRRRGAAASLGLGGEREKVMVLAVAVAVAVVAVVVFMVDGVVGLL